MTHNTQGGQEALKACPFCGGQPAYRAERIAEDAMVAFVHCPSCGVQTEQFEDAYAPREQAIAAWNARATPALAAAREDWFKCADLHDQAEWAQKYAPTIITLPAPPADRLALAEKISREIVPTTKGFNSIDEIARKIAYDAALAALTTEKAPL